MGRVLATRYEEVVVKINVVKQMGLYPNINCDYVVLIKLYFVIAL